MTTRPRIVRERDPLAPVAPITASSIPVNPPKEWFENPNLTEPTPLTITSDGRVYGHIAAWSARHIGLPGDVRPPKSKTNYSYFHTGVVACADGSDVPVGQLTLAGGHAPLSAGAAEAVKHYDDTASAVVDMHCGEDAHGIWAAGAVRPGTTDAQIRALRASAPSGDWRPINGRLELVACCQVNVPGFPIARGMVAGGALTALVAAGAQDMLFRRLRALDTEQADRIGELESMVASVAALQKKDLREKVHADSA